MDSCPWSGYEPASISFCENRLCSWIVEPANTWSNIGFVLVGLYIFWARFKDQRVDINMIALTAIFVGINSALFHATGTRWGEIVDVSAMYLISSLFIVLSAQRLWALSGRTIVISYLLLATSGAFLLILSRNNGIILFAAHITVAVILETYFFKRNRDNFEFRNLAWMAICFAVSFTSWKLDISKKMCDPDNHIFGGHALWHLGNALCLWFYFRYQAQFEPKLSVRNR